jgi:hypothetical protein
MKEKKPTRHAQVGSRQLKTRDLRLELMRRMHGDVYADAYAAERGRQQAIDEAERDRGWRRPKEGHAVSQAASESTKARDARLNARAQALFQTGQSKSAVCKQLWEEEKEHSQIKFERLMRIITKLPR